MWGVATFQRLDVTNHLRITECRSLDGGRAGQGDGAAAGGLATFTASDGAQFGGEGVKGRIFVGVCWVGKGYKPALLKKRRFA